MMRTKAIPTTKWGTACAQCATAKAKCSGRSGTPGSKCDRCERLLKQCTDQVHRPRKTRQPRQQPSSSNTDSGAFDSLVSTPENAPASPSAMGDIGDTSCSSSSARSRMGSFERPPFAQSSVPDSYFYSAPPNCLGDQAAAHINPLFTEGQDDLDEMLLTKYRNQLMPLHPFVLIPDHVPAAMLKAHRPFLMLAIRMVAGFESLQSMRGQIQQVMDYLADRMFRQAERSLDLLMGIVVVLGWYHYHCMKHSQLNNLLCLAESLVSDLGLNRRPAGHAEERSMDEKRLLLGVWYLRSSAAMYLQQLISMPFTSYMRQCLVDVQEEKEHDLDSVVVYYLKIQYLTERVAVLTSPQAEQEQPAAERAAAMTSSREYLDKITRDMPESLKSNSMVNMHLKTVLLRMYEPQPSSLPIVSNLHISPPEPSRSRSPSVVPNMEPNLQNTDGTVRSWFEAWVKGIPLSIYRSLPASMVFQLLYAVGSLVRSNQEGARAQEAAFGGRSVSPSSTEAIHILDRLVALSLTAPDMTNFWAALGERYEEVCSPPAESYAEQGGDEAPVAPMGWSQPSSSQSPPRGHSQASQPMYHGSLFIPPSRAGSVGPAGQDDYQVGPTSVPMIPVSGSMGHLHPNQWVVVGSQPQAWESGHASASWHSASSVPQMMMPEEVDPQLWMPETAQQGPNTYSEGGYYHMG